MIPGMIGKGRYRSSGLTTKQLLNKTKQEPVMKTSKKFTCSVVTILMIIIFSGAALAQHSGYSDRDSTHAGVDKSSGFMILENHFACFQQIKCLKDDDDIRGKGLKFNFNGSLQADQYILQGQSVNEIVEAKYDSQGELIEGRLVHVNVPMPSEISRYLVTSVYSDWQAVRTERVVHDFDSRTTEYSVVLQKGDELILLNFDKDKNRIRQIVDL
jgi:hypothetical protein